MLILQPSLKEKKDLPSGRTPLIFAAMNRATNVARVIMEYSKEAVDIQDSHQCLPISYALKHRDLQLVEMLIPNNAPTGAAIHGIWDWMARYRTEMSESVIEFVRLAIHLGKKELNELSY